MKLRINEWRKEKEAMKFKTESRLKFEIEIEWRGRKDWAANFVEAAIN